MLEKHGFINMKPGKDTVRMVYIQGNSESVAATNINKLFNLNKSCVSRSLQIYKQLSTKMTCTVTFWKSKH